MKSFTDTIVFTQTFIREKLLTTVLCKFKKPQLRYFDSFIIFSIMLKKFFFGFSKRMNSKLCFTYDYF